MTTTLPDTIEVFYELLGASQQAAERGDLKVVDSNLTILASLSPVPESREQKSLADISRRVMSEAITVCRAKPDHDLGLVVFYQNKYGLQ